MRLQLRSLVAAVTLIFAGVVSSNAIDIYLLSTAGSSQTALGKVDSTTGAYTQINGNLNGLNLVRNLTWSNALGSFYAVDNGNSSANLRTLTTTGTLSNPIGTIGKEVYGMAFREADSNLYAYDYNNDKTGTINPNTGAWTGLNNSPGMSAYSPIGGRYSIMNDTLYVSYNNNSTGLFGTLGYTASSTFSQRASNALFVNMVLANDGVNLYGLYAAAGTKSLYTIDPTTGATTFVASITGANVGTTFYGAAVAVPEPSTYALAAIATGVVAAVARRRKARKA